MDTGLVCYLVGLQSPEHLVGSPMAGALFETAVVSNFKKMVDAYGLRDGLYFYRSVAGLEVDLIVDHGGELIPIEIKLSATLFPRHWENIKNWQTLSKNEKGLMVIGSRDVGPLGQGVVNVHRSQI